MGVYEIFVLFMNPCVVKSSVCSAVQSLFLLTSLLHPWELQDRSSFDLIHNENTFCMTLYKLWGIFANKNRYRKSRANIKESLHKLWSNLGHITTFIIQDLALKVSQQKPSWNKNSLGNFWIKYCNFGYVVPLSLFNNLQYVINRYIVRQYSWSLLTAL